jgi:hypothetical protein
MRPSSLTIIEMIVFITKSTMIEPLFTKIFIELKPIASNWSLKPVVLVSSLKVNDE